MRSFIVSRARRRVGLAGVQAMARHRISRFPYIGVPRATVEARAGRGARAAAASPAFDAHGFFAYQVGPGPAGG